MEKNYDNLLSLAIEIEGLLSLLSQGHSNAPERVIALLKEKVDRLESQLTHDEDTDTVSETVKDEIIASAELEQAEDADPFDADDEAPVPTMEPAVLEGEVEESKAESKAVEEDKPMKLDEKLAIEGSRDIRRAFTLNDRFRFRRELFENSEARFVDALEVISAMSSFDEAQEYFYDDLCWDPDSEHVKEFMQKVQNHFR